MSAKPCGNNDWAAGLVQVEQTCTLVGCNLNRHACCSSATVPSIPVSQVQLQHTLLVVRCNLHRWLLSLCLVNRQVCWVINSKWVWPGNTTITNRRQTHGTARKSHTTIMRHQKHKLSKATSSVFPINMIAKLEWILSNVQQNIEQLQTPTMGGTINKKSTTTTEPQP